MSPFIVTTKRPGKYGPEHYAHEADTVSRRAVATLEEIREGIEPRLPASALAETPCTIGPLPDGTVIEVVHASWDDLVGPEGWGAGTTEADVVAAYNAAQP